MKLQTILDNAHTLYTSGQCIYLKGRVGVGKTTTLLRAVKLAGSRLEKNLGVVVMQGPTLNINDVLGYLVIDREVSPPESVWSRPSWFRTSDEHLPLENYDGGVVIIDEMDKCDIELKKILGEMALSGRCGPHQLPPGWVVWMAGNRRQDRSGSTNELDHLINRRIEIETDDDLDGLEQFLLSADMHPDIISFVMQNPNVVFPDKLPEKQGPFPTPRSVTRAGELLVTLQGKRGHDVELPTDQFAAELVSGSVGEAAGAQLMAHLRVAHELPDYKSEILRSPATARVPDAPDALMLVAYRCAALVEADTLVKTIEYVRRLPADFGITFAKAMTVRRPALTVTPPMLAWVKENRGVMAVLSNH